MDFTTQDYWDAKDQAYFANEKIADLEKENALFRAALELIACPMRPDGTFNRDRMACYILAKNALDGNKL